MRTARRLSLAVTLIFAGAGAGAAGAAGTNPEEVVDYRQSMMKANGAHLSAAMSILEGKVPWKGDLGEHVKALEAINRDLVRLFPAGSKVGETSALDDVWKKGDEFKKRAAAAAKASEALARAVASGDAKAQGARLEELGNSCRDCHRDFRKPMM